MAGGSFFHKVIQYVANEVIVDKLANNPSFQRFAVRSSQAAKELVERGHQKKAEMLEKIKVLADDVQKEIMKPSNK